MLQHFRRLSSSFFVNREINTKCVRLSVSGRLNLKCCFSHEQELKCWKCGKEQSKFELFCTDCKTIQNPYETRNYFKLFQLNPEHFAIDTKLLSEKYRKMQSLLHPDKFTNKSEKEKSISANYSALINKAYHILLNSIKRANHLLELKGENIDEQKMNVENPEFLMEIMELNEKVDNVGSNEELKQLNYEISKEIDEIFQEFSQNVQTNDMSKAKENFVRIKYYNSVSLRINALLREKGIVD